MKTLSAPFLFIAMALSVGVTAMAFSVGSTAVTPKKILLSFGELLQSEISHELEMDMHYERETASIEPFASLPVCPTAAFTFSKSLEPHFPSLTCCFF